MSSDPKRRGSTAKKRDRPLNRHEQGKKRMETTSATASASVSVASVGDHEAVTSVSVTVSVPCSDVNKPLANATPIPTRSEMKLYDMYKVMDESDNESIEPNSETDDSDSETESIDLTVDENLAGNRIIDVGILQQNIPSQLSCGLCHSSVSLIEVGRKGLASELAFHCSKKGCNGRQAFSTCEKVDVNHGSNLKVNSVNRRATFAMRCIGCDHEDLRTFCGIMNLPPPACKSSHQFINKTIESAANEVLEKSMSNAATLEYEQAASVESTQLRNIDVSCDGTWLTRGHSSKVGAASVIGCETGKVLGVGTRSKVCKSCQYWDRADKNSEKYRQWRATHDNVCTQNHDGSSGAMEKDIVKDIFCSSANKYNLRFTRFIGDGDTNSFKTVHDAQPYGPDISVKKIECVGHIQKRMGTRLRNLKKNMGDRKLEDGKSLGGRKRPTKDKIDVIQSHYGNAIRGNRNNLVAMREAVWAVYFHYNATDEEPTHNFCKVEWCPYKQALAEGTVGDYKHTSGLPKAVMSVIKPVFKDLANTELLEKCLEG